MHFTFQNILTAAIEDDPELGVVAVEELHCKTGNKLFQFELVPRWRALFMPHGWINHLWKIVTLRSLLDWSHQRDIAAKSHQMVLVKSSVTGIQTGLGNCKNSIDIRFRLRHQFIVLQYYGLLVQICCHSDSVTYYGLLVQTGQPWYIDAIPAISCWSVCYLWFHQIEYGQQTDVLCGNYNKETITHKNQPCSVWYRFWITLIADRSQRRRDSIANRVITKA